MSNSDSYQFTHDPGAIDDAPEPEGEVHIGGIYSGGQGGLGRGEQQNNGVRIGPVDLGGFTARTQDHFPITDAADLQPDSVVTVMVDGRPMEVDYAIAKANGLLSPQGLQQAQQDQQRVEQKAAQREAEDNKVEPLDPKSEALMREAVSTPEGQSATFHFGVDMVHNNFEVTENMVNEFASAQRIEPSEAKARVDHVMAAYHAEAVRAAVRETGAPDHIVAQVLYEARESSEMKETAMAHWQTDRARGYGKFVLRHIASLADTPEGAAKVVAANPHRARLASDGSAVVRLDNGQELSWANAILSRKLPLNK